MGPPRHVIRLRGPWQYEVPARTRRRPDGTTESIPDRLPPPGTISPPYDGGQFLGVDFFGRVLFRRRFGKPTGLDSGERVFLVVQSVDAFGTVELNGNRLGAIPGRGGDFRLDVTDELEPQNDDGEGQLQALNHCMSQLDEKLQQMLSWRYWKKGSVEELAQEQKKSLSATKMQLMRTRDVLKKCIRKKLEDGHHA